MTLYIVTSALFYVQQNVLLVRTHLALHPVDKELF
jgi:hypothetical protein